MHVSSKVAMVMPEIGLEDEPISPVRRRETVTNRKPKTTIRTAPMKTGHGEPLGPVRG